MATTTIQSNLVPIKLSTDGTTYKTVVCKKSWSFTGSSSVTEEETDCGTLTGLGAYKWSFDLEGVLNSTPASTETSVEDMLGWSSGQTLLYVKAEYPVAAGTDFYMQGTCYLTDFKVTNSVGSLMTFTGTLKGTAALDITP